MRAARDFMNKITYSKHSRFGASSFEFIALKSTLSNLEGKFLTLLSTFLLILIFVLSSHWLLFDMLICQRDRY